MATLKEKALVHWQQRIQASEYAIEKEIRSIEADAAALLRRIEGPSEKEIRKVREMEEFVRAMNRITRSLLRTIR